MLFILEVAAFHAFYALIGFSSSLLWIRISKERNILDFYSEKVEKKRRENVSKNVMPPPLHSPNVGREFLQVWGREGKGVSVASPWSQTVSSPASPIVPSSTAPPPPKACVGRETQRCRQAGIQRVQQRVVGRREKRQAGKREVCRESSTKECERPTLQGDREQVQ